MVWSSSGPHAGNIGDNNNGSSIFFTKSTDTGNTFMVPITIINQQFKNPSNVQIVQDKNEVYIAAQGVLINTNPLKNMEIFLINSSVTGNIFQKAVNVSKNGGVSECPSLAVSGSKLYITWEDDTPGNHEILFTTKTLNTKDFQ